MAAQVETAAAAADNGKGFVGSEIAESDRPRAHRRHTVVSGGRALGSAEKFNEVITPLADSWAQPWRAAPQWSAGYTPDDLQVGQTGKIVAPQLYVAAGISGAIQRLAGIKGQQGDRGRSTRSEAPIFSVADYGLEADLRRLCLNWSRPSDLPGLPPSARMCKADC